MAGVGGLIREWKHTRRCWRAEAEVMSRPVGEGASHGLPAPLIVSLTSYPARFPRLHLVLRELLSQTVRPDQVILWLDEGDQYLLPPEVLTLSGLTIATCPNWRCYKKLIPTLAGNPGAYIVTADDDVYYTGDWLAGLVGAAQGGVACRRAHRITLDRAGLPLCYEDWQRNIDAPERSHLVFPTGVGGVIYAPGVFHPDVCDADLFQRLAPGSDDLWLYWMHRMQGSKPCKIGGRFRIVEWPETQRQNLRSTNLAGDGNDRAIAALVDRYGFPG